MNMNANPMLDYYQFKEVYTLFNEGHPEDARKLLAEMQSRYIEVCDENAMLKTQVEEMEDILYLAKNLVFDGSCYWLITGSIRQGPFCPSCYDREGSLIRLDTESGEWRCPVCNTVHESVLSQLTAPRRFARHAPTMGKVISFSS